MSTKLLLRIFLFVAIAGIGLANTPNAALANNCKGIHANDPGCPTSGSGNGGSSDTISASAHFSDSSGTLQGDGFGDYVDGVDYVLDELADNTGFRVGPQDKSTRTSFIDFGPITYAGCGYSDGCISVGQTVTDGTPTQIVPVECPIPYSARPGSTSDTECSGLRPIWVRFKDVFVGTSTVNILYMPPDGQQYLGQGYDKEIDIQVPKHEAGSNYELIFKTNPGITACAGGAENLGVTATDSNDDGVTDAWEISTDTSNLVGNTDPVPKTKVGCLVKSDHKGETFVGYVVMKFTLDISRL